ncbi:MAG: ATP-dependent DNA helicase RecG [Eubacteriales bacterium]|nr:ATP-dependent DNA helicase RecG [Eubacteriales bacterium]
MKLSEIGATKRQETMLAKRNILSVEDLALFLPTSYRDYRQIVSIQDASPDQFSAFSGKLVSVKKKYGKKAYLVMRLHQADGTCILVLYFSEVFLYEKYQALLDQEVVICGRPAYDDTYGWSIKDPSPCVSKEAFVPSFDPVYRNIEGVSVTTLRSLMEKAVSEQIEPLEKEVLDKYRLPGYRQALQCIHFPEDLKTVQAAKMRLMFNDLLYFSNALGMAEAHRPERTKVIFERNELSDRFIRSLPYELTEDQTKVVSKFRAVTRTGKRFQALVQGDVGCGKTVVAISMMVQAAENGYQCVLIAPREVLAAQHFAEVKEHAERLHLACAFLHSGMSAKEKKAALSGIADGSIQMIVGTHACLAESVRYANLGLLVTDEEHLFGVKQKEALEKKNEQGVHSISMSATPIPRSLAVVLYGNTTEIMVIKSMPKGRIPIQTAIQHSHKNVFPFIRKQVSIGHQCYVVCPAIDDNDEYGIVAIESIEKEYRAYFDQLGIKIGIVNGKLDKKDVAETISRFEKNEINILISTTVIEVGVNVPNATVMVIEQAERFGLASLHQLRGRVGRSSFASYCILVSSQMHNQRLETMVRTTDGFEIAEADLAQRGSGDLIGDRQAGNNRFINEMVQNPIIFQYAMRASEFCSEMGFGAGLNRIYGTHAESVGEEN